MNGGFFRSFSALRLSGVAFAPDHISEWTTDPQVRARLKLGSSGLSLRHPDIATPHSPKAKQNTTKDDQKSMSESDLWFSGAGAFMAASAYHSASGYMEIVELYKIYVEKRPSDSSERIGRLLGYIASSTASTFTGGCIIGSVCDDSDMVCQEHIVADIYKDARTLMFNVAFVDTIKSLNINF